MPKRALSWHLLDVAILVVEDEVNRTALAHGPNVGVDVLSNELLWQGFTFAKQEVLV